MSGGSRDCPDDGCSGIPFPMRRETGVPFPIRRVRRDPTRSDETRRGIRRVRRDPDCPHNGSGGFRFPNTRDLAGLGPLRRDPMDQQVSGQVGGQTVTMAGPVSAYWHSHGSLNCIYDGPGCDLGNCVLKGRGIEALQTNQKMKNTKKHGKH